MKFSKTSLSKSITVAFSLAMTLQLAACGGQADDRKASLFDQNNASSHHDDHSNGSHQHDETKNHHQNGQDNQENTPHYDDDAGSISVEKRYPYKGDYPLTATLENLPRNTPFQMLLGNTSLPVLVGLSQQQPYVVIVGDPSHEAVNDMNDWDGTSNAVDMVAMGMHVYILDDQNRFATFGNHGDHFHGHGKPNAVPTNSKGQLAFVASANAEVPWVFDKQTGQLWQVTLDKSLTAQFSPTIIGGQNSALDFKAEHIVWVGSTVDKATQKVSLQYHPDAKEGFETLDKGRLVVTGKTAAGQQKIAVLNAAQLTNQSSPASILFSQSLDYPITALDSSADGRFAVIISDQADDNQDKVAFLDSGLSLESHGDHSHPIIAQPTWLAQQINKPNPIANSLHKYAGNTAIAFAGNDKTSAGVALFNDVQIGQGRWNYQELNGLSNTNLNKHILAQPTGEQLLIALPNRLLALENNNGQLSLVKQTDIHCPTPLSIAKNTQVIALSCDTGLYNLQLGYRESDLKKLAYQQVGIDNPELLSQLEYANAAVAFNPNDLSDDSIKRHLASIDTLSLSGDNPLQLNGLQNFSGVTKLYLDYSQIKDTSLIIQKFPNVEEIGLSNTGIKNFDFLANLPKLTSVDLSGNDIKDASFLTRYPNLSKIALSGNPITNIDFVKSLPNIKVLTINNIKTKDISVLSALNQLTELNISSNQLSNLPSFAHATNLTTVYAEGNKLTNLASFANLPKLTLLKAENNQISRLSDLTSVPNLETLELSNNKLTDAAKPDIDRLVNQGTAISIASNPVEKSYGKNFLTKTSN